MANTNKACCSLPPVVSTNYVPKGTYEELNGIKTYVTGPRDAKTGVLVIYDIFGFFSQTIQGADIIASAGHLVIMPDFFHGKPLEITVIPPNTPEKQAKLQSFFAGPASPPTNVAVAQNLFPTLQSQFSETKRWGVIGYCWGGKITTLLSGKDTKFVASAQIHPAMLNPEEAKEVSIPHLLLASKDEPAEAVSAFKSILGSSGNGEVREKSVVETYGGMFHGWMAARSNLEDEENRREYERGYKQLVSWLAGTL
ncbi:hypothetical protein RUND412_006328 [Rhizina undulata]